MKRDTFTILSNYIRKDKNVEKAILNHQTKAVKKFKRRSITINTSTYHMILTILEDCIDNNVRNITIITENGFVVNQIQGKTNILNKNRSFRMYNRIMKLKDKVSVEFTVSLDLKNIRSEVK